MSNKKVAIKLSTLEDIGNAIRYQNGGTEPIPVNTFADSVRAIGANAENKLAKLVGGGIKEITEKDLEGATRIREYIFTNSSLEKITIPNSVTVIAKYAFSQCYSLGSRGDTLIIPDSVTRIWQYAFQMCYKLSSVIIGNGVTQIDDMIFTSCNKLTSVTIGKGITKIGTGALLCGSKDNKSTITFLGTIPPTIAKGTFSADYNNKIIVPKGCGEAYKSATNWANFADLIEEAAE